MDRALLEALARVPRIPATTDLLERRLVLVGLGLLPRAPGAIERLMLLGAACERAFQIAERFAIGPSFARSMLRSGVELPLAIANTLTELVEHTHARNAGLLEELAAVGEELDRVGVRYVATKGAAILLRHVRDLGERHLDDVDLLIDPRDLPEATRALLALGAVVETTPVNVELHPLTVVMPLGTKIEVHVRLPRGDERSVLETAIEAKWGARRIWIEDDERLISHICHHVIAQHIEDPRPLPRHLVDIKRIQRTLGREALERESSSETRVSLTILDAIERYQEPPLDAALAAWLFPSHHTLVPSGVVSRLFGQVGQRAGLRLPNPSRVRSGLVFRV